MIFNDAYFIPIFFIFIAFYSVLSQQVYVIIIYLSFFSHNLTVYSTHIYWDFVDSYEIADFYDQGVIDISDFLIFFAFITFFVISFNFISYAFVYQEHQLDFFYSPIFLNEDPSMIAYLYSDRYLLMPFYDDFSLIFNVFFFHLITDNAYIKDFY